MAPVVIMTLAIADCIHILVTAFQIMSEGRGKHGALIESFRINAQPVLSGGPIQPERGFVLHHGHTRWVSSHPVNDEWVLTTSRDVLEAIAAGEGPDPMLVALGYAGWEPGQLERELRENAWLTMAAKQSLLFETPLDQRWAATAASVGVDTSRLMHYAGNA